MARGFESKDVEFQQAEAERTRARAPVTSPDQRHTMSLRGTVTLALTHARAELAATTSPVRRATLAQAIGELEGRLSEMGSL